MALPFPISSDQTKAKAPIDQNLMDSIRLNLDALDQTASGGAALFNFNVNGPLRLASNQRGRAQDTAVNFSEFTPTTCRAILKKSGNGGKIKFDLRKSRVFNTPITSIISQFESETQSIGRMQSALNTQSINRTTATTNTQSIEYAKDTLSVQSIVEVGPSLFRYNFLATDIVDNDYRVGDFVFIDGCTNADNDGNFEILQVNQSGFPSIVIRNTDGEAQLSPDGTVDLQLFRYNFTNPADSDFTAGENATFAGHEDAGNDGLLEVAFVNRLGNSVWVYNENGIEQSIVQGTVDIERWVFAYSNPINTDIYAVGETAFMSDHSSADNNGNFKVVDINRGDDNLVVYNESGGSTQGAAAGTSEPNRFVYALNSNPINDVEIDDFVGFEDHTSENNNGIFKVVSINFAASNNLVIFNEDGEDQAGADGGPRHTKKLVNFFEDESENYNEGQLVEIRGAVDGAYNHTKNKDPFTILEVNRGGGANFNIVIDGQDFDDQVSAAGFVANRLESIFVAPPEAVIDGIGIESERSVKIQSSNFAAGAISSDDVLLLYLLEVPSGSPRDISVILN